MDLIACIHRWVYNFFYFMSTTVSVIILCYNKSGYTDRCLSALAQNTPEDVEIIVWDNASTDDTENVVKSHQNRLPSLKYFYSKENLGFGAGNNQAVGHASGSFLFFLNNDAEPQKGWLRPLLETMQANERAGAVGCKLVYPDGRLQEAGGIIFSDASGHNLGKGADPLEPLFNVPREVDYCSGAALMARADLFRKLGGFDPLFDPAYYEDTDLCFSMRKAGYTVMIEPRSVVIHHEGATSGTDTDKGFKRFQKINHAKFARKWARELAQQPTPVDHPSDGWRLADRRTRSKAFISPGAFIARQSSLPSGGLTFGKGCYADEGDWRWIGPDASFFIWSQTIANAPMRLSFELASGNMENYACYSFLSEIRVNGVKKQEVEFTCERNQNKINLVLLPRSGDAHIRVISSAKYVPNLLDNSSDLRELSLCLRHLQLASVAETGPAPKE